MKSSSTSCGGRHLAQRLALGEDHAFVLGAGDAEVGRGGLADAVDGAAEHRDFDRLVVGLEALSRSPATTVSMSNCSRPQVGQAISTGPFSRSWSALRISQATLTSSSAWKVESEIRIVSPMPSASNVPRPTLDFSEPRPLGAGLGDPEVQRVVDLLG